MKRVKFLSFCSVGFTLSLCGSCWVVLLEKAAGCLRVSTNSSLIIVVQEDILLDYQCTVLTKECFRKKI